MQFMVHYIVKSLYTKQLCFCMLLLVCTGNAVIAQDAATPEKEKLSLSNFNTKAIDGINKQYAKLQGNVEKQSQKMLERMQSKEAKLKKKVQGMDSTKAATLFNSDVQQQYTDLQNKLKGKIDSGGIQSPLKEYIPGMDSLQTSLSFLQSGKTGLPALPGDKLEKINALSSQAKELQGRMQQASDIQSFIRERESLLKEKLANTGLSKQLTGMNKEVVYYQQRLNDYKALLNDKDKLKDKLLSTVRTLPAFQKFWQRNSMLAQLFPMPAEGANPAAALAGLQSREGRAPSASRATGSARSAAESRGWI